MKKKIGIMGGTFNPIHYGHLLLAETAYNEFNLDEVLIMPTKVPAYKNMKSLVSSEHRINMINYAISNNKHLSLSQIELNRAGNTYTIDTLNELTSTNENIIYYFIMGADSLFQFENWREPENILKKTRVLVASRDELSNSTLSSQIDYLSELYDNANISILNAPNFQVSSHDIRNRVHLGKSIKYMLPDEVIDYIIKNKLYI